MKLSILITTFGILIQFNHCIAFAGPLTKSQGQLIDRFIQEDPKGDYARPSTAPVVVAKYITFNIDLPLPAPFPTDQSYSVFSDGNVVPSSSSTDSATKRCGVRMTVLHPGFEIQTAGQSLSTTSARAGEKFAVLGTLDYGGNQILALKTVSGREFYLVIHCEETDAAGNRKYLGALPGRIFDSAEARDMLGKKLLGYSEN